MMTLIDALNKLKKQGYKENLVSDFDHFSCQSGKYLLYPPNIFIDQLIRIEDQSDPESQALVYAISCKNPELKGVYVESYGLYHDELSSELLTWIKSCQKYLNQEQKNGQAQPVQ